MIWIQIHCIALILNKGTSSQRLDQRTSWFCFVKTSLKPRKGHCYLIGFVWQTWSFLEFIPIWTTLHSLEGDKHGLSHCPGGSIHLSLSTTFLNSSDNYSDLKTCLSSVNLSTNRFNLRSLLLNWREGSVVHLITYCGQDSVWLYHGKIIKYLNSLLKDCL